jgi:hypothetical protein
MFGRTIIGKKIYYDIPVIYRSSLFAAAKIRFLVDLVFIR